MGLNHAVDVLRGSENMKVMAKGHQRLSTHGIGQDQPTEYWQGLGKQLIQRGYLKLSDDGYNTVELTPEAGQALKERKKFRMKPLRTKMVSAASRSKAKSGAIECDEGLFEVLRKLRKDLSDARGVPPYVVFGDVALRQMARRYPRDEEAFLSIPGVGQQKLREYGDQFIQVIDEWLLENDPRDFEPNGFLDPAPKMRRSKDPEGLNSTSRATLELFQQDKDVDAIAAERNLNVTTIETHLAKCIEAGKLDDFEGLVDAAEFERIREAVAEHGTEALRPIYEVLNEEISYGKIRLAVAKLEWEKKVAAAR
jgi:ATP-dependent DNA helicase RecQ